MFANKQDPTKFYTAGEEIFNAVTHGVGSLFAIIGTSVLVTLACCHTTWHEVWICLVYGLSLIILYTMSTLYHAFPFPAVKKVFRIFDHTSIFLLIAGTYTPLMLIAMDGSAKGVTIFCVVWGAAILGVLANAIALDKFEKLSLVLYVIMGWAVVFAIMDVVHALPLGALLFLVAGGVAYTGGILFYKSKRRYMHSVWHLFVLLGSVLHYICIAVYVLPMAYIR